MGWLADNKAHAKGLVLALVAGLPLAAVPSAAAADSCWDHNGSIMRMKAAGQERVFQYDRPRKVLSAAGVKPGTVLFEGRNTGDYFVGSARVFSKHCPGSPLVYAVEGPVKRDPLRVIMIGERQVFERCKATGRTTVDRLVFTYKGNC